MEPESKPMPFRRSQIRVSFELPFASAPESPSTVPHSGASSSSKKKYVDFYAEERTDSEQIEINSELSRLAQETNASCRRPPGIDAIFSYTKTFAHPLLRHNWRLHIAIFKSHRRVILLPARLHIFLLPQDQPAAFRDPHHHVRFHLLRLGMRAINFCRLSTHSFFAQKVAGFVLHQFAIFQLVRLALLHRQRTLHPLPANLHINRPVNRNVLRNLRLPSRQSSSRITVVRSRSQFVPASNTTLQSSSAWIAGAAPNASKTTPAIATHVKLALNLPRISRDDFIPGPYRWIRTQLRRGSRFFAGPHTSSLFHPQKTSITKRL